MTRSRYVCLHGHFYQPPRENPWLEAIERQDTAYPHHDWNERITTECYGPNARSRILDARGRIRRIVNNYAGISFNFGPTLLSWMEQHAPEVYRPILRADQESVHRFGGHGSALAQVYNHMILPLANARDRKTQVRWGLVDFRHRFGRDPEGMWLPETAVDTDSLEVLAEEGVRFTILAPRQVSSVRGPGEGAWQERDAHSLDTTRPYRVSLPSGREIAVFFYDGRISRDIAFNGLLRDGAALAERLVGALPSTSGHPPLVHAATDGETYGHHHRHGEMALSYALEAIEARSDVELTNYAGYLAMHPPEWEARIREDTSWSCVHGVERWRSDCGCHAGRGSDWHQAWRSPLRHALDWLRDRLITLFEEEGGRLFLDPWQARDDYVAVVLDRSQASLDGFFESAQAHPLEPEERVRALKLVEMQRHAMLMYTSCGWFFDDISGIETAQVIQYAGRAVQLGEELGGGRLESGFLERLARAPSNLPDWKDGAKVYHRVVDPARVDLRKVGAHYAVTSLFDDHPEHPERARIYCYEVERQEQEISETGRARLAIGRIRVHSRLTWEATSLSYGVLDMGDHNVTGGVREFRGPDFYDRLADDLRDHFARVDLPSVLRMLDRHFHAGVYSLHSLLGDEQRRIVASILEGALAEAEAMYARLYEDRATLIRFLADLEMPVPRPFRMAGEYVLNLRLRRALQADPLPDVGEADRILREVAEAQVELDEDVIGFAARGAVENLMALVTRHPEDVEALDLLMQALGVVKKLPFQVSLWEAQNRYYDAMRGVYPARRATAIDGDPRATEWVRKFLDVGERIGVAVDGGELGVLSGARGARPE